MKLLLEAISFVTMAMRRMSHRRRLSRRSRPLRRTTLRRRSRGVNNIGRSGNKDQYLTSTAGSSAGGWNYKRKRLNKRAWVRRMQAASNAGQKHRSNNALQFTFNTALVRQQQRVFFVPCITDTVANPFWTTLGGLVVNDGDSATTSFGDGDLYLRGGKSTLTLTNTLTANINNGDSVKVRTWRCRTTTFGVPLATPFIVSQDWDPTLPDPALGNTDTWRLYKILDNVDVILKANETYERSTVLRSMKVDQSAHLANQSREFWIVSVGNISNNVATNIQAITSHNLSFTGDRTV